MDADILIDAAIKYIRTNERRRRVEVEEAGARKVLEELMATSSLTEVATPKGTVRYQDAFAVEYDYQALASVLPPALMQFVSKLTVNSRALDDLVTQGAVDPKHAEAAKRVKAVRRLVIVSNRRQLRRTASAPKGEPMA